MVTKGRPITHEGKYFARAERKGDCFLGPNSDTPRRLYIRRHGPIPVGLNVCHSCDAPRCLVDAHHWLGTQKQNMEDAKQKGRMRTGPLTASAKLKMSAVRKGVPKSAEHKAAIQIAKKLLHNSHLTARWAFYQGA